MVMQLDFLVALSEAETFKIPLASMSKLKVTSTWGTPWGAGRVPDISNLLSKLLSLVQACSETSLMIQGIQVKPPTKTISWTFDLSILDPESWRIYSTGSRVLWNRSWQSSLKQAWVREVKKSIPSKSKSISMDVWVADERVCLARSQAVWRCQRTAQGFEERLMYIYTH